MSSLVEFAPAKINLSLHVLGRRADGLHDLESLVVFADVGDALTLDPGPGLALAVDGETAAASGPADDNLVLKAARTLADRVAGLRMGHFRLTKHLPVAAGLGGGSSDAAAALRLLARSNDLALADPRIGAAAWATGADCPVCLDPRPCFVGGAGERVERLADMPALDLVLVNPRIAVATTDVFATLGLAPGGRLAGRAHPPMPRAGALSSEVATGSREEDATMQQSIAPIRFYRIGTRSSVSAPDLHALLVATRNDLADTSRALCPAVGDVERALAEAGASLVRMSGSGATVWGLATDARHAERIAAEVAHCHPGWWVAATRAGGA